MSVYFGDPEQDRIRLGFSHFETKVDPYDLTGLEQMAENPHFYWSNQMIQPSKPREDNAIRAAVIRWMSEWLEQMVATSTSDTDCQFGPDDPTQPINVDELDEPWDDWEHLDMCDRCEGLGYYDPFVGPRQACDKCDGSKWVGKGEGLSKEQAEKLGRA